MLKDLNTEVWFFLFSSLKNHLKYFTKRERDFYSDFQVWFKMNGSKVEEGRNLQLLIPGLILNYQRQHWKK